MATPTIQATKRFSKTKKDLKTIRAAGDIPAVMYGKSFPPRSLVLQGSDFRARAAGHRMIEVMIDGEQIPAVVQDIMRHPIDRAILHIELHAVALDQLTNASIPVILNGLEKVERSGGIVQQQLREVEITGLPQAIPDYITHDISRLKIGDTVHAKDLQLPTGITLLADADEVVLSVLAPKRQITEDAPAASPALEQQA